MPMTINDLEVMLEDFKDDIRRIRRLRDAAYALAVAVKERTSDPIDGLPSANDEKLSQLADAVITEISPARS